ncbi:hypothetical protein [Nocardia abscessus]|nr:hypothetical protein [Nocardia abscessus]
MGAGGDHRHRGRRGLDGDDLVLVELASAPERFVVGAATVAVSE